jgi:beta-lactam-binding protein with PASTA domain
VRILEKTKIQWGSRIDLVISGGLGNKEMPVPSLTGMTYAEAKAYLDENGISQGALSSVGNINDTASAYVVKQSPERFDQDNMLIYIKPGQLMDIWISQVNIAPVDSLSKKKENNKPDKKE